MLNRAVVFGLWATLAGALKPLSVQGNQLVLEGGGRFFVVGVAYQPGGSAGFKPQLGKDALSDGDACLRDAAVLQSLGVNTIRVYNLDPYINHDACASIFNAAGIYMQLDVNSPLPGEALYSLEPWTTYTSAYLNRTFALVEAFKDYPNTALFFSGNEVINDVATGKFSPAYVRAVTRDLKMYVAKHASRPIPVGYSAADVRSVLFDAYNYFVCALNGDASDPSRADLFALNSYSWCGDSSYTASGYDQLVTGFGNSPVPVYFSEFGCNNVSPRTFSEIQAIYGPDMTPVLSGGVVYEYTQEANNYGLLDLAGDGSATLRADFYALQKQYAKVDFKAVAAVKPAGSSGPKACNPSLITEAGFENNFTLPVLPPGAQQLMDAGVSPKPVGKLVPIASYASKFKVKNSDGSVINGLAVKPLPNDEVNVPGSNPVTSSSPTGTPITGGQAGPSSSSSSPPDRNVAPTVARASLVAAGLGAVFSSVMYHL